MQVGQRTQQLWRAGERPYGVELRGVLVGVQPLHLLDLLRCEPYAGLTQQGADEEPTAHADATMDAPGGQVDANLAQRVTPGDDVLVDGVDQRAVKVEQQRRRRRLTV